jgi:hypothetical protein
LIGYLVLLKIAKEKNVNWKRFSRSPRPS